MMRGERVVLRRIAPEDGELWAGWLADPELNATLSSGLGIPMSAHAAREAAEHLAADSTARVDFTVLTLDGRAIGSVHLAGIDPWARRAELGIFIGEPEYRARGFGTEITVLLTRFAFRELNLHKVWLTVDADNVAAVRCYEKAGYRHDGVLRDEVFKNGRYVDRLVMSVLRHEYDEQAAP